MTFEIGDQVVFPAHGAGVIQEVAKKEVLGEEHEYFRMSLVRGDMEIMVPREQGRELGVRPVIDEEEVDRVKDVLKDAELTLPKSWPARNRKEKEILDTGSAYDLARLLGVLQRRDFEKGLPTTERYTFRVAVSLLASEIALARDCTLEVAQEELEAALAALEPN